MTASNTANGGGASWPDVALAIVAFAREDTWKFLAVVAVLVIALWFLFPRATVMLRERYNAERSKQRRKASAVEDRAND